MVSLGEDYAATNQKFSAFSFLSSVEIYDEARDLHRQLTANIVAYTHHYPTIVKLMGNVLRHMTYKNTLLASRSYSAETIIYTSHCYGENG